MILNGILVLSRGYETIKKYTLLIKRNRAIYNVFYSKLSNKDAYEIVIFHEGNITQSHQHYIQTQTPDLPLIFKRVQFVHRAYPRKNQYCHSTDLSDGFSDGYKNMCQFWSVDLFTYVYKYAFIIRIDEDCILNKMSIDTLTNYAQDEIYYASPQFIGPDCEKVTIGMQKLFQKMNKEFEYKDTRFPYTNFFIMYVPHFLQNKDLLKALSYIKDTQCIFINRWGDMPLWGFLLASYVPSKHYMEDKRIGYLHGSHNNRVNSESTLPVENYSGSVSPVANSCSCKVAFLVAIGAFALIVVLGLIVIIILCISNAGKQQRLSNKIKNR